MTRFSAPSASPTGGRRIFFALLLLTPVLIAGLMMTSCEEPKGAQTAEATAERTPEEVRAIGVARQFLSLLVAKQWAPAASLFDDKMREAMPVGTLATTWKKVQNETGAYESVTDTRVEAQPPYRSVLLTVSYQAATGTMKVVVDANDKIAGLWFSEAQEKPGAKKGGEAPPLVPDADLPEGLVGQTIMVGAEGWPLPGVLVLPAGEGPFPGVVLVHGSGPHDRDETIGPNKPFKELAYGLAQRGVAVLRYEKRSKVHASTLAAKRNFTVFDETVDDAAAAVEALRAHPKVKDEAVFVVGHSLGGYLLPRIGQKSPSAAGFIGLAAASGTMWDAVDEQLDYLATLEGQQPPPDQLDQLRKEVAAVRALDPKKAEPGQVLLSVPVSYWVDLKGYRPTEVARKLDKPFFFLQGGRDYQVTDKDLQRWVKALEKDVPVKERKVMYKTYPNLNHLFQEGEAKSTPAEYMKAGSISPIVLDDVAAWVKAQSR